MRERHHDNASAHNRAEVARASQIKGHGLTPHVERVYYDPATEPRPQNYGPKANTGRKVYAVKKKRPKKGHPKHREPGSGIETRQQKRAAARQKVKDDRKALREKNVQDAEARYQAARKRITKALKRKGIKVD